MVVTEFQRQSIPMATMRRLFSGLSILGLSVLLLTGCVVPGGYDVNTLHLHPEAALVYPGSTGVHTNNYGGAPGTMSVRAPSPPPENQPPPSTPS
jgi:hypothetical protein